MGCLDIHIKTSRMDCTVHTRPLYDCTPFFACEVWLLKNSQLFLDVFGTNGDLVDAFTYRSCFSFDSLKVQQLKQVTTLP